MSQLKTIAAACIVMSLAIAPLQGQTKGKEGQPKGKGSSAEIEKLRADVAKLRADLDDALREINALKAALGGKVVPEDGALYRGRAAKSWLNQLKDADANSRVDAIDALSALAKEDKKLIVPLIDTLKKDTDYKVLEKIAKAFGNVGSDALPPLIELAKDKAKEQATVRRYAIKAIGNMRGKGKLAVPVLVKALRENDVGLLHVTVHTLDLIGPDAKEAIPALIDALADSCAHAAKPESGRFGDRHNSINYLIFDAIQRMDPDLAANLKPPPASFKGGSGKDDAPFPIEFVNAWYKVQETLAKRYVERK